MFGQHLKLGRLAATAAGIALLGLAASETAKAQCGGPTKEYVRLGGRVIAIENYPKTPAPVLPSGTYVPSLTLTPPAGGWVYYTTNGNPPDCGSSKSASAVTITLSAAAPTTVKAFNTQPGYADSDVVSGTFTLSSTSSTMTPASTDFSFQAVGTTSTAQDFLVTNTGNTQTTLGITTSGDFAKSASSTCGATLAANQNCKVSVTFTPTALGPRSGQLSVTYGGGSPLTASLTGTGSGTTLNPAALNLSAAVNGSVSGSITMTYYGSAAQSLQPMTISPSGTPFSVPSNTCGSGLASGAQCTITVSFAPAVPGSWSASLTVTDGPSGNLVAHNVALSGNTALSLSPATLDFGSQITNTHTNGTVTLSNALSTAASYTISNPTGDFALGSTTCSGGTLAANSSCTITVIFTPTTTGVRTGTLTVNGAVNSVALQGTGLPAPQLTLSPTTLNFGTVAVGSTATQTVVVQNTTPNAPAGGDPKIAISNPQSSNGAFYSNSNCATLAAQQTCSILVTFAPATGGSFSGTVSIADGAGGHSISVTGGSQNQVGAPTFSIPNGQQVVTNTQVTITAPAGASIVYTSDGTNPSSSASAQVVASPFTYTISSTVQLAALARMAGSMDSAVVWSLYIAGGVSLSPGASTLLTEQYTKFAMTATTTDNWASINDYISFTVGTFSANGCGMLYQAATSTLTLRSDDGSSALGPYLVPSNMILANSQCMVNLAEASVTKVNSVLTLTLPVSFTSNYLGDRNVWLGPVNQGVSTTYYEGTDTIVANSLTVTPDHVSLLGGQGQLFSSNTGVTWSLTPSTGWGTITSGGQYSAPATVGASQIVKVTATSQTDSTKSATALISLTTGTPVDLYLTNLTLLSGSATYRASHSITADTNVVIGGTANVTFSAGSTITLGNGFRATAPVSGTGTTFHAVIQ